MRIFSKSSFLLLSSAFLLATNAHALDFGSGDILQLARNFTLRSTLNFYRDAKNEKFSISSGADVKVISKPIRLASGNYGVKVQIQEGPRKGLVAWLYYRPTNPGVSVNPQLLVKQQNIPLASPIATPIASPIPIASPVASPIASLVITPSPSPQPTPAPPINMAVDESTQDIPNMAPADLKNDAFAHQVNQSIADAVQQIHLLKSTKQIKGFDPGDHVKDDEGPSPFAFIFGDGGAEKEDFTPRASADTCTPITPDTSALGDDRNQGALGWCFSYTAADLISQKLGHKLSALDTSITYYEQPSNAFNLNGEGAYLGANINVVPTKLSGGETEGALATILARGNVCSEADMPSNDQVQQQLVSSKDDGNGHITNNYNLISLADTMLDGIANWETAHQDKNILADPNSTCKLVDQAISVFPNLDIYSMLAILQQASGPKQALNWMTELDCKNPVSIPSTLKIVKKEVPMGQGSKLMHSIDDVLSSGQIVGITYDVDSFIRDPDLNRKHKGESNHASSIVARQFRNGQCEYKVRNSWGATGCSSLNDTYGNAANCERGDFWVSEDDITKHVSKVEYLK